MPDPESGGRAEFLRQIADQLPFGEAEKQDILGELASHIADSTSRFEADGLTGDAAERAAIERLGPPERLADNLADARHSSRRLLAAAGAGTWSAAGGVVYGYLLTVLVLVGVTLAAFVVVGLLHSAGVGAVTGGLDQTTMTLIGLGVGANIGGQRMTTTMAARAGYRIQGARRTIALIGGLIVLGYSLVGWKGQLNWPEVALLLSLPAWFIVGAWRATPGRFPSLRWRLKVVALECTVVVCALALGLGQARIVAGSGDWQPAGIDRIALPTPDAILTARQADGYAGGFTTGGVTSIWVGISDPSLLSGWGDFRVEAWRGVRLSGMDPELGVAVDPAATAPFAIGPARLDSGQDVLDPSSIETRLGGSVAINHNPSVTLAWVVLTGVAPDGKRYFLDGPSYQTTAFNGTALDWFGAVLSGK